MSSHQRGGIPEGRKNNPDWKEEMETRRRVARRTRKCAQCGYPVKSPRRWFCSTTCQQVFFVYYWGLPWRWVRHETLKRDNYTCQKCGFEADYFHRGLMEVDHILEVSMGGLDEDKNLQTLCSSCHKKKTAEFLARRAQN